MAPRDPDNVPLLPGADPPRADPCALVVLRLRDTGDPLAGLGWPGRPPALRLKQLLKLCLRKFGFMEVGGGKEP